MCRNACAEWKGFDRAIDSSRQPFHAPTLPLPAPVSHTHLAAVAVHVPHHALESHGGGVEPCPARGMQHCRLSDLQLTGCGVARVGAPRQRRRPPPRRHRPAASAAALPRHEACHAAWVPWITCRGEQRAGRARCTLWRVSGCLWSVWFACGSLQSSRQDAGHPRAGQAMGRSCCTLRRHLPSRT